MKQVREVPPKAGAMIEALRGLGYSTASAIADIIDNSISADARVVDLLFDWDLCNSKIFIIDDGHGMNISDLESAMRLGEKNPLDDRKEGDLGRFGLGLKTASFSQCRRLTVASKKDGFINSLYWDLDVIANDPFDRWLLLEGLPETITLRIEESLKKTDHGTVVAWELLDRVITSNFTEQDYLDLIDSVEEHLSMIFHRFLDGSSGNLVINLNGKKLKPWDPFMDGNMSKPWHSAPVSHPSDDQVIVECHVLPHKDKLSPQEYQRYQGPEGWTSQQGFYVYRGGRMLLAGSWLGLGKGRSWTKDEAHRLARIRLDIPTTDDSEWKIDIKKATAKPPVHMRKWLIKMAEITRNRARKVFAHRGQVPRNRSNNEVSAIWTIKRNEAGIKYQIDLRNPVVQTVLSTAGNNADAVKAMIKLIEETVPIQRIWLDTEEQKDTPRNRFQGEPPENMRKVLYALFTAMTKQQGLPSDVAIEKLKNTDPFQDFETLFDDFPIH